MAIDLKKLDSFGCSKEFQLEIIKLDQNSDLSISPEDLIGVFGETALKQHYSELETAIQENNPERFKRALEKMQTARTEKNHQIFSEIFSKHPDIKQLFKKYSRTACQFKNEPEMCSRYESCKKIDQKICDAPQNLAALLTPKVASEFHSPFRKIDDESAEDKIARSLRDVPVEKEFLESFSYWNEAWTNFVSRETFPEHIYNDFHQDEAITKFEQKYLVNIQYDKALSQENFHNLQQLFTELEKKRPQDLPFINLIVLYDSSMRGGGSCSDQRIYLHGLFSAQVVNNSGHSLNNGLYSNELDNDYTTASTQDYARRTFFHEWGHAVAKSFANNSDFQKIYHEKTWFEKMGKYQSPDEWFAEDYSKWIRSDGHELARINGNNEVVPFYDERLAFFQKYLPIQQVETSPQNETK